MTELLNYCRICLQTKPTNTSLYLHVQQKYLPSVIENICGVVISSFDEPEALICKECAEAIIRADNIIQKCQESHKILLHQRKHLQLAGKDENKAQQQEQWLLGTECKQEIDLNVQEEEQEETQTFPQHYFVEPELLVESILENSQHDVPPDPQQNNTISDLNVKSECNEKKVRKRRSRLKIKDQQQEQVILNTEENPAALLYQSHFKTSKPKKTFVRSREQYLKRKIRNYPVKEPLKLIGGAGVVRKRKPKSYHRAIPNFYFRCELCHEFESNVASYAVTHLTTVHGIERPAIFRCSQCDAKPFIKNQSLQEHIATIHEQQPKKRDFVCQECGKTFIKNCHLQKHLLSVHKMGEMPYKCNIPQCGKGYVDAYALRMHMKQSHHIDDEEQIESLTTLYQCDACGKSFMDLQSLNVHIKTVHSVEGFSCLQCGYNFRQKARYETHVRRAKCKPPCFVCRHCERTFVKLVQLEEHQREMH
ncbi:zinc finger protein 397-like [Calliphora vicina]|uniref:zinc finger protein 397-like n=1 Tax=Calliphora vicina TaxID=7373 RepID=UPI00325C1904